MRGIYQEISLTEIRLRTRRNEYISIDLSEPAFEISSMIEDSIKHKKYIKDGVKKISRIYPNNIHTYEIHKNMHLILYNNQLFIRMTEIDYKKINKKVQFKLEKTHEYINIEDFMMLLYLNYNVIRKDAMTVMALPSDIFQLSHCGDLICIVKTSKEIIINII